MRFSLTIRQSQIETLSAVCTDLTAGFILLAIGTNSVFILFGDIFFAIMFFVGSVKLKNLLNEYDEF